MILADLLDLDELGLTLVAGDDQLDREIRWVYTTDLPDPRRYLSGGELVLTSTLWRHEPADSEAFVSALVSRRVAGLVAGHDVHGLMPEDLIDACGRRSLPLFNLPDGLSFGTISEIVIGRIMTERDAALALSLHRHRRLLSAIAGDVNGSDGDRVTRILEVLAGDPPIDLWVLSPAGRVVASTTPSAPPPEELRAIWHGALTARAFPATVRLADGRRCSVFPIGSELGEFLVGAGDHRNWSADLLDTVTEIAQFVAVERAHVHRRQAVERSLAGTLVSALTAPATTVGELDARLEACGLDGADRMLVVTAAAPEPNGTVPAMARVLLEDAVTAVGARAAIGAGEREVIAVVATTAAGHEALETQLRTTASWCTGAFGSRIAIGVSGVVTGAAELHCAVLEAGHARALAAVRSDQIAIATSIELSSHALLLATSSERARLAFHQRLIGPLLEHDRTHRGELVVTLATFLDEACGWRRCAARLHVHVNTLRYRIQRIEELTGRDMESMAARVDFYLALRAADPGAATLVEAVAQPSRE